MKSVLAPICLLAISFTSSFSLAEEWRVPVLHDGFVTCILQSGISCHGKISNVDISKLKTKDFEIKPYGVLDVHRQVIDGKLCYISSGTGNHDDGISCLSK